MHKSIYVFSNGNYWRSEGFFSYEVVGTDLIMKDNFTGKTISITGAGSVGNQVYAYVNGVFSELTKLTDTALAELIFTGFMKKVV